MVWSAIIHDIVIYKKHIYIIKHTVPVGQAMPQFRNFKIRLMLYIQLFGPTQPMGHWSPTQFLCSSQTGNELKYMIIFFFFLLHSMSAKTPKIKINKESILLIARCIVDVNYSLFIYMLWPLCEICHSADWPFCKTGQCVESM